MVCAAIDFESTKERAAQSPAELLTPIFARTIPSYTWHARAQLDEDRRGTDFWAFRGPMLSPLSVDVKIREVDPLEKWGKDDLAIEVWSAKETRSLGWSLNDSKQTDLVLWVFPTGRYVMMPFGALVKVCQAHIREWCGRYERHAQTTAHLGRTYTSEHIFVPRRVLFDALFGLYSGAG